jgi:hypothetical protein
LKVVDSLPDFIVCVHHEWPLSGDRFAYGCARDDDGASCIFGG